MATWDDSYKYQEIIRELEIELANTRILLANANDMNRLNMQARIKADCQVDILVRELARLQGDKWTIIKT